MNNYSRCRCQWLVWAMGDKQPRVQGTRKKACNIFYEICKKFYAACLILWKIFVPPLHRTVVGKVEFWFKLSAKLKFYRFGINVYCLLHQT